MKQIFSFVIVLVIIFNLGCSKEEVSSEPTVTTEVVKVVEPTVEEEAEQEVEENITTVRLCHDTDKGIIRWVPGKTFGFYSNATRFEFEDYCENKNYLVEYYCEDESPLHRRFLCKNGCVDAHCT